MNINHIIRAWKDEGYRNSLSEADRAALPANPAGRIELTDVEQEHAAAQHAAEIGTGRFENCADVLQALLGLRLDVGAGEPAGCGIGRALAGHKNQAVVNHAGRIWTDGLR